MRAQPGRSPRQACLIDDELQDGGLFAQTGQCAPDDDATLCNRRGANCGPLSLTDNCGGARTVQCGDCLGLDGGNACGLAQANQCVCQPLLQGCAVPQHCCAGTTCRAGLCCVPTGGDCHDEADCCVGACIGRPDGGPGAICAQSN